MSTTRKEGVMSTLYNKRIKLNDTGKGHTVCFVSMNV